MTRFLIAFMLMLAAVAVVAGQTNVEAARGEMLRGAEQYRAGNYAEAQRHFERMIELNPSFRSGPTLLARALHRQYKPGDSTPENVAKARAALAVYERILAEEPDHDESFNVVIYLYRQLKDEEGERRWLWRVTGDASMPANKRAVAYIILAARRWDCAFEITAANKTVVTRGGEPSIRYVRPKSRAEMGKARGCATEGLRLVEEAVRLDASNPNAWAQKANLMRELSKLAEMDGDARLKDYYDRRQGAALETHSRLAAEEKKKSVRGQ